MCLPYTCSSALFGLAYSLIMTFTFFVCNLHPLIYFCCFALSLQKENDSLSAHQNTSECERRGSTAPVTANCGTLSWVAENRTCSPVPYTGEVCRSTLLEWQDCIVGQNSSNSVLISVVGSQSLLEHQATQTSDVLSQLNIHCICL